MKNRILSISLIAFCLFMFAGCSCMHNWVEADCQKPKTCSKCHETYGEVSGHTPGECIEAADVIACTVFREQYCSICKEQIISETVPLDSLIRDNLFLFTPEEFMSRLTVIAERHSDKFTYEFVPNGLSLQALVDSNGTQSIIQFFRPNATALASDEIHVAEVWCVSLVAMGESDANFRQYFYMACDPALDKDAAFDADMDLSVAFLNASAKGERFGYFEKNQLLYETSYTPEGELGLDDSMSMVNIYASDFR